MVEVNLTLTEDTPTYVTGAGGGRRLLTSVEDTPTHVQGAGGGRRTLTLVEDTPTYELEGRVTIQTMTDILTTSAKAHGTIWWDGEVTQHGHCWNTTGTPTIADDKTELGAIASAPHTFETTLTDLLPSTIHYVRAYATDGERTEYSGAERPFRTSTPPPVVWRDEAPLPFTPDGQIFFSSIIGNEVYVIDQGYHFYKYNLKTRVWTELTSPNYGGTSATWDNDPTKFGGFNRTLAISPDGKKLACCSEGVYYTGGSFSTPRNIGGMRIEIYTIATNSWSASKQVDFNINDQQARTRAIVWEDNDILWVWCCQRYSTSYQTNLYIGWGKCVKYTISIDTWTPYTTSYVAIGRFTGTGLTRYGAQSCAAIKADKSEVYIGAAGGGVNPPGYTVYHASDRRWCRYIVADDEYWHADIYVYDKFCFAYDRDKLWYYGAGDDCRQGYIDTADNSANDDQFEENTDRDAGYGQYCGISDDLLIIIAHARSPAPESMSYGVKAEGMPGLNPALMEVLGY